MKQPKAKVTSVTGSPESIHNRELTIVSIGWVNFGDRIAYFIGFFGEYNPEQESLMFTFHNNGNNEFWDRYNKLKAELC